MTIIFCKILHCQIFAVAAAATAAATIALFERKRRQKNIVDKIF
jgi:hypothetical protein